jgi:hypothetical protein
LSDLAPRPHGRRRAAAAILAVATALITGTALADWLYPDISYREAQSDLRAALRDTVGHPDDARRLDTLGVALMRLGKLADAERTFRRVRELAPDDGAACASLGKLALFANRLGEAESLLTRAGTAGSAGVDEDLFAARYRAGEFASAADLAATLPSMQAREAKLRELATSGAYRTTWDGKPVEVPFKRAYPVPLVRGRINGKEVLLAIDTGAGELILDPSAAKSLNVRMMPGASVTFWSGRRVSVGEALVARLDLDRVHLEQVPAQTTSLHDFSLIVNPQGNRVDGIIGLELLRRFTPTLDYRHAKLRLGREPPAAKGEVHKVPFQVWGEHELTVWGSLNGGRSMAMVVASAVPECGIATVREVLDEVGVKTTTMSKLFKGPSKLFGGVGLLQANVPNVVVGSATVDRVGAWAGALEARELWWHGVRRDAMLSHDFLRRFRVTIDWTRGELLLEE